MSLARKRKERASTETVVFSRETTLPSHIYPHLRRLFAVARHHVNDLLERLWRSGRAEVVFKAGNTWKVVESFYPRPGWIPSRVWRNICKLAGDITKSQRVRVAFLEWLRENPWWTCERPRLAAYAFFLETGQAIGVGFVKNLLREVRNRGGFPDWRELVPRFSGSVFVYGADDDVADGQAKKIDFLGEKG